MRDSSTARTVPNTKRLQPMVTTATEAKVPATVLVVDREPMLRKALIGVLHRLGYKTLEASGAIEARRLAAARKRIDLLVVDFSFMENNALELVRWFQAMFPRTKALVTTDSLWELLYQGGQSRGFVALAKPFSDLELGRILERTLG